MAKVDVRFTKCIQDSQEFGSTDEHMVSRMFFNIAVDGKSQGDTYADLKQTVGDTWSTGSIEVGRPVGYKGPFNHDAFAKVTAELYRNLVGSLISAGPGAHVRMHDNQINFDMTVSFETDQPSGTW